VQGRPVRPANRANLLALSYEELARGAIQTIHFVNVAHKRIYLHVIRNCSMGVGSEVNLVFPRFVNQGIYI